MSGDDLFADEEIDQFGGVGETDFALVGVRNLEWRLSVIRSAARRSASNYAQSLLSEPSDETQTRLTQIVLTTYRLIDPRRRDSHFQQIRIGRVLPLTLQHAAGIDFQPRLTQDRSPTANRSIPSDAKFPQTSFDILPEPTPTAIGPYEKDHFSGKSSPQDQTDRVDDQANPTGAPPPYELAVNPALATPDISIPHSNADTSESVAGEDPVSIPKNILLFGHEFPTRIEPNSQPDIVSQTDVVVSNRNEPLPIRRDLEKTREIVRPVVSRSPTQLQKEAYEVFTELRQQSFKSLWQKVVHDPRVLVVLIALTASTTVVLAIAITKQRLTARSSSAVEGPLQRPAPANLPDDRPSNYDTAPIKMTAPNRSVAKPSSPPAKLVPSVDQATVNNVASATAKLGTAATPTVEKLSSGPLAISSDPLADPSPTAINEIAIRSHPEPIDMANIGSSLDTPNVEQMKQDEPKQPGVPKRADDAIAIEAMDFTPTKIRREDLNEAMNEIWEATTSAARRFTSSSADELIDHWDVMAELAGPGSVEWVAAKHLILQAGWLTQPFHQLVAMTRQIEPTPDDTSLSYAESLARQHDDRHLTQPETELLVETWRAARSRAVHAVDVNQILHQATVLLDRIIISNRTSPLQKKMFIESLQTEVQRLTLIASDESLKTEVAAIFEAIATLPDASEWERLQSSAEPSGFLGRLMCLKQRRWKDGLAMLTKTSDPALAAAAKAEQTLLASTPAQTENSQSDNSQSENVQAERIELAQRWLKIAAKLPPHESAAIHLHALELFGDDSSSQPRREELIKSLPRYLDFRSKD